MQKTQKIYRFIFLLVTVALLAAPGARAQIQVSGDFMTRNYWESTTGDRDNRGDLTFMRLQGRLTAVAPIGMNAKFRTDLVTTGTNPVYPTRVLGGTGETSFGIAQIYGEFTVPDFLSLDLARFRFGRQHYELGNGLTLGESFYQTEEFDGIRADFAQRNWTLGLFGAITKAEISPGGYFPEPGSDQLYVAQLQYEMQEHTLLAYSVYEKERGVFNDNIIFGVGSSGSIVLPKLQYFVEAAHQTFNTLSGLPDKGGMGYMAGLGYSWSMRYFRTVKVEVRTAAYEGDDASTDKIEIFSPIYPSWWWGDRTGFANGDVGGDYPHDDKQIEGSRVYYGRIYFSPTILPKARIQFQYVTVGDFVNNDGYTEPDDEYGIKVYYQVSDNVRLQGRYFRRMPNDGDYDLSGDGNISKVEDKVTSDRLSFECRVQF